MRDTVKEVRPDGVIERTVDRTSLWLAQTPQAFRRDWIETAHRKAHAEGVRATDDAFLVEWLGYSVAVVEGSGENIKVTRPEDLVIGEAILMSRIKQSGTAKT
jgi:2-C-methyl-D-erythritol 4-phosphate cytidylyltransferase